MRVGGIRTKSVSQPTDALRQTAATATVTAPRQLTSDRTALLCPTGRQDAHRDTHPRHATEWRLIQLAVHAATVAQPPGGRTRPYTHSFGLSFLRRHKTMRQRQWTGVQLNCPVVRADQTMALRSCATASGDVWRCARLFTPELKSRCLWSALEITATGSRVVTTCVSLYLTVVSCVVVRMRASVLNHCQCAACMCVRACVRTCVRTCTWY